MTRTPLIGPGADAGPEVAGLRHPFAAIPLSKGFDPGICWHAGKIAECGSSLTIIGPERVADRYGLRPEQVKVFNFRPSSV